MANDKAALIVRISADVASLKKAMADAGNDADKQAKKIEDRFSKINPRAFSLGHAAMIGAASGAAQEATRFMIEYVKKLAEANKLIAEIGKNSQLFGMSSRRLQEVQFAGANEGMKSKDVDKGLEGLGKKLNDARQEENDLTKLFDENNIKWKDREGHVLRVNEALMRVADMIRDAKTEFDRIKIAETAGLTKEWVDILRNGGAAFDEIARGATKAGAVIDESIIKKAKQFEDDWNSAWARWASVGKSSVVALGDMLQGLVNLAAKLGGYLVQARASREGLGALSGSELEALRTSTKNPEIRGAIGAEYARRNPYGTINGPRSGTATNASMEELRRAMSPYQRPLNINGTKIPSDKEKGGKAAAEETDQRYEEIERYIKQLEKTGRILEAEKASIGKSNAERAKAVELARIGEVTDADQLKKIEAQVVANEKLRESIEKAKQAKKGLESAAEFGGNQFLDVLDRMSQKGANAKEIFADLARTILRAAMQAMLLGQGPLAGLFGTMPGSGSSIGGLLGGFVGGGAGSFGAFAGLYAKGGQIGSGKWGVVGEAGPEIVNGPAMVHPPKALPRAFGGGGDAVNVNIGLTGAITSGDVERLLVHGITAGMNAVRGQVPRDMRETSRRF